MRGARDERVAAGGERVGKPGSGGGRRKRVALARDHQRRLSDRGHDGSKVGLLDQRERRAERLARRPSACEKLRTQLAERRARIGRTAHLQRDKTLQRGLIVAVKLIAETTQRLKLHRARPSTRNRPARRESTGIHRPECSAQPCSSTRGGPAPTLST